VLCVIPDFQALTIQSFMPDLAGFPPIESSRIIPPDGSLLSTFGMCEMEKVALIVLRRCQKLRTWGTMHSILEFVNDRDMVIGLFHLAANGWIKPAYPNSYFVITKGFAERVCR
jgi:hypothetical protein